MWALGIVLTMLLCFRGEFFPLLQHALHAKFWGPIAKLCYSAYLIHVCVLIMNYCSRSVPYSFTPISMLFLVVVLIVMTLFSAFGVFLLVEKPLANLQAAVVGGGGE